MNLKGTAPIVGFEATPVVHSVLLGSAGWACGGCVCVCVCYEAGGAPALWVPCGVFLELPRAVVDGSTVAFHVHMLRAVRAPFLVCVTGGACASAHAAVVCAASAAALCRAKNDS